MKLQTYRTERYGADSHRPEEIAYADTLRKTCCVATLRSMAWR